MKKMNVFFILVLTVLLYNHSPVVFAKTSSNKLTITPVPSVSPAPVKTLILVEEKKEEYILPYPGILPDHPLYFLKSLRDSILESLIVDPARKAEFYLLMADKHLNMVIMLYDQSKSALASQTVTKGEEYMSKAVQALSDVKKSGKTVSVSTIDKIEKSLVKHKQEITRLSSKTTDATEKEALAKGLTMIKNIQIELDTLK